MEATTYVQLLLQGVGCEKDTMGAQGSPVVIFVFLTIGVKVRT